MMSITIIALLVNLLIDTTGKVSLRFGVHSWLKYYTQFGYFSVLVSFSLDLLFF